MNPLFDIEQIKNLRQELDSKANAEHTHNGYIPTSDKGASNGVAPLVGGKIPSQYIPSSSGISWGALTGNITNQEDLIAVLNSKLDESSQIYFSQITGAPTTLSGYGITDAYTKTEADSRFLQSGTFALSTLSINAGEGLNGGGTLNSDVGLSLDLEYLNERYLSSSGTAYNSSRLGGINASNYVRKDEAGYKTSGDFIFQDNVKLGFGSTGDIYMYHDNSDFIINGVTEGNIVVRFQGSDMITIDPSDGSIDANGEIAAFSDIRLKKDLEIIGGALERVLRLNGYTWTRKDNGKRQTGLVANEVLEVLPEAVNKTNGSGLLSLAYGNLAGLLVEAIKDIHKILEENGITDKR